MKTLIGVVFCLLMLYAGKTQTLFIWPVKQMPSYGEVPGFYTTNNFVDSNNAAIIQDWNCGSRTYSGHRGIDIDLWPFTWSMMDGNYVAIVAAAPGRVVSAVDNLNNENNCGQPGADLNWNYIAIRHADSSTSIYGHIRTNSAQVTVGQLVTAGQTIAFVGSSGNSSNPHLHFEVNRNAVNNSQAAGLVDPYAGPCNNLNMNTSWWVAQKPYWESAVVRVMTHGSRPAMGGYNSSSDFCRTGEAKNDRANFAPNDSIFFGVAMRDYLQTQSYSLSVFRPNGTLFYSGAHTNSGANLARRYYLFNAKLPSDAASGTWQASVTFNGTTTDHFFSVNCAATQNVTGAVTGVDGYKTSNSITSTATVNNAGNKLFLQAGAKITLSPGFSARNGAGLKARIRECNYSE
ncbi:MAG: peptidoglycan DD-metalloendopeptidase family protein [Bacteroidota bacterium]